MPMSANTGPQIINETRCVTANPGVATAKPAAASLAAGGVEAHAIARKAMKTRGGHTKLMNSGYALRKYRSVTRYGNAIMAKAPMNAAPRLTPVRRYR